MNPHPHTLPNFPYYSTVDQIYHAEWSIPKLVRLQLLRKTLDALWPDGHRTKLVQVVGTSGKGSTSRFLETGFGCVARSGAFMSPHLFDYRERFSLNGEFATQLIYIGPGKKSSNRSAFIWRQKMLIMSTASTRCRF